MALATHAILARLLCIFLIAGGADGSKALRADDHIHDARRPVCGGLNPLETKDHDTMCVHFFHKVSWLGVLTKHNVSVEGTAYSPIPETIAPGSDEYWTVRDGTYWEQTGGGKQGARLEPYTLIVWFRGQCLASGANAPCQKGSEVMVGVTLSLRSRGWHEGQLEGEHDVKVVTTASWKPTDKLTLRLPSPSLPYRLEYGTGARR